MSPTSQYKKLVQIKPLEHLYNLAHAAGNQPIQFAAFPSMNCLIDQRSIVRAPGQTLDRTLGAGENIQWIVPYQVRDKTIYNLYLSTTDLIVRQTGSGKTYKYLTPLYTTGTISSMNTGKTVITGSGTYWKTGGDLPVAGDKFIIIADHINDEEPDPNWATIASVDNDTQITLSSEYTGVSTSGTYRIRKLYSVPTGERWSYAIVGNKFCFTNGNENVHYWDGALTTAADLSPAYAARARYCLNYANRLFISDCYLGQSVTTAHRAVTSNVATIGTATAHGLSAAETAVVTGMTDSTYNGTFTVVAAADTTHFTYNLVHADEGETADAAGTVTADQIREPWTLKWCKEGDPTNWTDSTAGEADFIGTESVIMGMGAVANSILLYKENSIIFGNRTGISTNPVAFPNEVKGVGTLSSFSIIHALGTNFFLGKDDFYKINGDHPESIGENIRDKFLDIIPTGERATVFGFPAPKYRMVVWFANTTTHGQLAVGYDYATGEWMTFKFSKEVTGCGEMM